MNKTDVIISAASVASAISAIHSIAATDLQIPTRSEAGKYAADVSDILATSQTQSFLRANVATHARTLKVDEKLLAEKYAEVAQLDGTLSFTQQRNSLIVRLTSSPPTIDLVNRNLGSPIIMDNTVDSITGCYNNCHSACHGSRGWR